MYVQLSEPIMEPPQCYIDARQQLLKAIEFAPAQLLETLQEALRQADIAVNKLMESAAPKQDLRNEISENEVSPEDPRQTEEMRKYCVPCTSAHLLYKIPFSKWQGRTNFRNANEGPCLHCPDTQVEVERVLAERAAENERKAALKPKGPKVPAGYTHPVPYPGFTDQEITLSLEKKFPGDRAEVKEQLKAAYEVIDRGAYRGMTLGYYWIHHVEAHRKRIIAAVVAEKRAQIIAHAAEDLAKDRIRILPDIIRDLEKRRHHLYGAGTEEDYDEAKDAHIDAQRELQQLLAQYGKQ
ncbi:MAG: hypothetical protein [Circoviridae sp.]|nr:MAG: hypothetical protein [Circoviridae sp.]